MRSFKQELGLSVLVLTACTLRIGESATDSASETGASSGSTGASSSGGETPTTGQVTSEGSTGAASTGSESTDSASTAANTSVGTDSTGLTGGDSTGVGESTGSTGGQELVDATVEDSCAPNDGPALEFHFLLAAPMCGAAWADLAVRVNLFQGGPLAPGSYSLGGAGFATAQSGDKPLVMTTSGTVVINAWDGDVVSGSYELDFVDAGFVLSGDFVGPHCPGGGLCG